MMWPTFGFLFLAFAAPPTASMSTPDSPLVPPPPQAIDSPNPWHILQKYAHTITAAELRQTLRKLYDPFEGLTPYLEITETEARLYPSPTERREPQFILPLASPEQAIKVPSTFRTAQEFRALPKPPNHPLAGLRLAIDPGHIGGPWGPVEERSTPYRGLGRIQEGDMNIITAHLLAERLRRQGAEVLLTRTTTDPVTNRRPADLVEEARATFLLQRPSLAAYPPDQQLRQIGARKLELRTNFLFAKKYEFLARAEKIRPFAPDLTVVLYINATPSSASSRLIGANQNIFFVHGAYTKAEASNPAQQLRLWTKLLQRVTPVEWEAASAVATAFTRTTGLKPVPYMDSANSRLIDAQNPYVVARNLAANRHYEGAVVVTEPYFMNNRTVAQRLLAGDYEGTRVIDGQPRVSIFREYADCVVEGIMATYAPTITQ